MMKRFLLLISFGVLTMTLYSQMPAWTDFQTRQEMYPDDQYLVAFVSGRNTNDDDPGEMKSVYESLAKSKIVQNIQVEIESNNSLNVSNVNGKSDEKFLSKSVTFSKADVSGLTTKSYYDRKKKEVYAISFVNRKELAFYYRNQIKSGKEDIEQKLAQGKTYVKKDDKENALRSFYETMPIFQKCDEARMLLIALNRKMFADIDSDEISLLRIELINEIDKLVKPNNLTLEESAYFISYGLFLQLQNNGATINTDNITYETTGLVSEFSRKLEAQLAKSLVEVGNYSMSTKSVNKGYQLSGNYWKEGDFIKVSVKIFDKSELIAVSAGSLPLSWLMNNDVVYIPDAVKKMEALDGVSLAVEDYPHMVKSGMETTYPVKVKLDNSGVGQVEGITLGVFSKNTGKILSSGITNENGMTLCYLKPIESNARVCQLLVNIDIEKYLDISKSDNYYDIAMRINPVSPVILDVEIAKPSIVISSSEKASGRNVDIPTLAPMVKQTLSEMGYDFTENTDGAEYIVKIDANTTTSSQYQGIYFAYLDINFVIENVRDGKEIYATHIDQVKGGGGNYAKASKKAYKLGAEKLKEELKNSGL